MKLPPFRLYHPDSVEEASRLLTDLGDDATAFCGGTELLLAMKLGLTTYDHLVDLKRVDGLRGVAGGSGGVLRIGAATTHHEVETSAAGRARYPEMAGMISRAANVRVRSCGSLAVPLQARATSAVRATPRGQRDVGGERFPDGGFPTTKHAPALAPGDPLTAA